MPVEETEDVESMEVDLLVEGVYRRYGYDFRNYARASLRRRVRKALGSEALATVSGLQERILRDSDCMERFLNTLSVNVTAMFRDPGFYRALRNQVIPQLRTYPFARIWLAGCSTGEEVYSLAILLKEEGIYDRCRIYATDMSPDSLVKAESGIFPLASMKDYTSNFQMAGGKEDFSSYYAAHYDSAIFARGLKKNLVFSQHNLATDASFSEFHLILCRNVMIYFDKTLQARVHELFVDSLCKFGFLGLGNRESLRLSPQEKNYEEIEPGERLYRKLG